MTSWLGDVGTFTQSHRAEKAARFRKRRQERYKLMRAGGVSQGEAVERGKWYEHRSVAQVERIERVEHCGAELLRITCRNCQRSHERTSGCRIGLLCLTCRGRLAAEKRARFCRARVDVIGDANKRGLLNPSRRGGRYSEKFLTLTAPHFPDDTIATRIFRVLDAWTKFLRSLNQHFKARDVRTFEWLRVLEWTPGRDDHGHPHLHLWLLSPFLDRDWLKELWRDALLDAGCPPSAEIIIDIREVRGEYGAAKELIKYLTKDITANGDKVSPALYAEVYKALDGRRLAQGSKGFMARAGKANSQCECGSDLPKRVRRVQREQPATPRGDSD